MEEVRSLISRGRHSLLDVTNSKGKVRIVYSFLSPPLPLSTRAFRRSFSSSDHVDTMVHGIQVQLKGLPSSSPSKVASNVAVGESIIGSINNQSSSEKKSEVESQDEKDNSNVVDDENMKQATAEGSDQAKSSQVATLDESCGSKTLTKVVPTKRKPDLAEKQVDTSHEQPSPRILPGPTLDGDSIDFPLSAITNHLICPLCRGYFRDPYTVADCLHSFCRSCLIVHFRVGHRRCPTW